MLRRQQNDIGSLVAPYSASPPGRPWVFGELGADISALHAKVASNEAEYNKLKTAIDPLLSRFPFSETGYRQLAVRVVTAPRAELLRLGLEQFALVSRGVLSSVSRAQNIARALLVAPTVAQANRAERLLNNAERTMSKYALLLQAVHAAQRGAGAVGLGEPISISTLAIAALIAGTLVFLVGAGALYSVLAENQATENATDEAERACALDAAAGHPCGGATYQDYVRRAREGQRTFGFLPNLNELLKQGGSLIFWGGLLAIGAALGYAAWTAEPARRNVQERLRTASMSGLGGALDPTKLSWSEGGVGSRKRWFAPGGYSGFAASTPGMMRVFRYGTFVAEIPIPRLRTASMNGLGRGRRT
jgi:hypothetical protein